MLTFFIKRPRFAMVIALVITLLGAIALRIIPVEQYPQITPCGRECVSVMAGRQLG